MYKIIVKKFGELERILLAENLRELKEVVNLSTKAEYEIISVNKVDYDTAKEFINEIQKNNKPKDLIFGKTKEEQPYKFLQRKLDLIAKYLYKGNLFVSDYPFVENNILYFSICVIDKNSRELAGFKIKLIDVLEWMKKNKGGK